MNQMKRLLALVLASCLLFGSFTALAAETPENQLETTGNYLLSVVTEPTVSSAGGEWAVLGLARSGLTVPTEFYESYYAALENYVTQRQGVLHSRKYTEYSRVVVALTAMGADPTDVAGYDLLQPLGDYDKTVYQGLNGAIWALIALDAGDYAVPTCAGAETQASRELYVQHILDRQLEDGGFTLSRGSADPDVTAMALQALAPYRDREDVAGAMERALECLSALQQADGDFPSWGGNNCESVAQVLVALGMLNMELTDSRFVKNGNTVLDGLMKYALPGGGFRHLADSEVNQMATEQAFLALVALERALDGQNSFYDMSDAADVLDSGMPQRHAHVQPVPVSRPGAGFDDVTGHADEAAILALAERGIIDGMGDGTFTPDDTMTRAQFAAIVTRALGLSRDSGVTGEAFTDVPTGKWYAGWVATANGYGLVNGRGGGTFDPEGTITRQEAAIMVANAAVLCGLDTEQTDEEIEALLAPFTDQADCSAWAREALAACVQLGVLEDSTLRPREEILRCEIARMVYNLLLQAELL